MKPLTHQSNLANLANRANLGERLATLLGERERLLSFVEKRVGSRELAEEILQDAFVRSVEKAAEIRADESVIAWFYRLLRNAIIDRRRRSAVRERAASAFAHEQEAFGAGRLESEAERGEVCSCMSELIQTLKPEYESAIRSVDLEGGTLGELASSSGISPGNAAVRLHRARRALGERLRSTCGACADHACLDCGCKKKMRSDV